MTKIFISYSRQNHAIVERLRHDLQQAGLDIWIDNVGLQPGTPDWDQALRDAIGDAKAILLAASPDSRRSAYVADEIALGRAKKKPIFPIWVDGDEWLDSVPMGLGRTQNLDLRGDNYATNLPRLISTLAGTTTEALPVVVEAETPTVPNPRNPYKGLRAFRDEDSGDFFGRESLVDELVTRINEPNRAARLLAVLGASGSGKSSVMMAGVLPKLRQEHPDWVFLDPMVPGAYPLEKLTITLARRFANKAQSTITEDLTDKSTRGLHRLVAEMSDKTVVLYIDQFEEVFTLVEQESERRQFIDLLTAAMTEPAGILTVLLSMRADFYDRPAAYREFGRLIETCHTLITPMTLSDLYDVVQKPATLPDVGLHFDDELVTEMVFAVREQAAALPLLQFTLDQLFQRRDGNRLTLGAYREIGGVQGALARHAEVTYDELPTQGHKDLARALFLRLIEAGQTEQDTTRRRMSSSELTLSDAAQTRVLGEVAEAFVNARLLVSDQSGTTPTLEVSHEALIREWGRLREWLHDKREDLRLQKSLAADVSEWFRRGKPEDMLYRGTILSEAHAWAQRNTPSQNEVTFLDASQHAETERQQQEAHAARRLRYLAGGLVIVIILASLGLAFIFAQNNASLQEEADQLQAQASTAEFQSGYVQAQVNWLAMRQFPLSPAELTQTPAPAFIATATAQADLAAWEPQIQSFDGIEMVLVPAGCFWMGSNAGDVDERPVHEQCFEEPFWIDRYEVTNDQFGSLPTSDRCFERSTEPDQPRNCVSWFDARDYCEARGARLPTEREWEYAARGPDNLVYPWGNEWNPEFANWGDTSPDGTFDVGSFPGGASWVGAMDMSGNVWEWVSTIYGVDDGDFNFSEDGELVYEYPYDADDGREGDQGDSADVPVLRGGSFGIASSYLRAANRLRNSPYFEFYLYGFRCARSSG